MIAANRDALGVRMIALASAPTKNGRKEFIEFPDILAADVSPQLCNEQGVPVLSLIAQNKEGPFYARTLELFLDHGAPPDQADPKTKVAPLHHICLREDALEPLKIFLRYHPNINARDRWERTPLLMAALGTIIRGSTEGLEDVLEALLQNSANAKAADHKSQNALHYLAKSLGSLKSGRVLHILQSHGCDIEAIDCDGNRPLHLLADSILPSLGPDYQKTIDEDLNMLRFFVQAGADINAPNAVGDRPLHIAARQGHWPLVEALHALGADPALTNAAGESPALAARAAGFSRFEKILEKKVQVVALPLRELKERFWNAVQKAPLVGGLLRAVFGRKGAAQLPPVRFVIDRSRLPPPPMDDG